MMVPFLLSMKPFLTWKALLKQQECTAVAKRGGTMSQHPPGTDLATPHSSHGSRSLGGKDLPMGAGVEERQRLSHLQRLAAGDTFSINKVVKTEAVLWLY